MTKVRTLCQECSDWYEYEIGAESSEHCPKCLFAEADGTAEQIKDLWERVDSAEADWASWMNLSLALLPVKVTRLAPIY